MAIIFDPNRAVTGDQPAADYISGVVVSQALPALRMLLGTLTGLQSTWHANGIEAQVVAAATAGENLAGYSPEVWNDWGVTLTELQVWLQTPIESIGKTPAQVLLRQYPREG